MVDTVLSNVYGVIDGFLDYANPLEEVVVFGYDLSIPNIGPIDGYEFEYSIGYVSGAVAGVGAQLALGVVSGGATAPACATAIVKLGVLAAKTYTAIDTLGGIGEALDSAHNIYTNSGEMTGWEIAGNVAMIGLDFAPALGHVGGVALKKMLGPDFLKLGGCFVAGTPVHLSSTPAFVAARELALASVASENFGWDVGAAYPTPDREPTVVVSIESVPIGARISTKNPEPWDTTGPMPDPIQSDWRLLSAKIEREDGARVEVELLRPLAWITDQGFFAGGRIYLELEELRVSGWANIHSISECPTLSDGTGNLVTGRFITREATNLVETEFSDGTVITGTDIHPV